MGERERILIADDDKRFRFAISMLLTHNKHTVVATANGIPELEEILKNTTEFAIAIIDGKMPLNGDGEIAAKLIKNKYPNVVVISLSVTPQTFGDYNLSKTNAPSVLLETINKI